MTALALSPRAASTSTAATTLRPISFGPPSMPLFGLLELRRSGTWLDRGILICAPLGHENLLLHRPLRVLGRILAERGRPVLRFDWPGSGDSAGDDTGDRLVARSLQAVGEAARALREQAGVDAVDLIGLRIGATLGLLAALDDAAVDDVVAWAPFATGKSYVRELRAFHRLADRSRATEPDGPEVEEASGFPLTPELAADLQAIDLTAVSDTARRRRVLLVGRDAPPETRLVEALRSTGCEPETAVLEAPPDLAPAWSASTIPYDSFEAIADWLAPGSPAVSQPLPAQGEDEGLRLEHAGKRLRERGELIGGQSAILGVSCVPDPALGDPGDTWIVFVANRFARRIGPHRMYTRWAREWAARGVPSLRVDVGATGDAGGPDEETLEDLYGVQGIEDAREALAYLRERYGARRFVTVGFCSGASVGFNLARSTTDVVGVMLLAPQMLVWVPQESTLPLGADLRRNLFRARAWKHVLGGGVPVRRIAAVAVKTLLLHARRHVSQAVRGDHLDHAGRTIRDTALAMADRGCPLLLVLPEGHPGIAFLERHLGDELAALERTPGIEIVRMADTDHTFRERASHDVLRRRIEGQLETIGVLPASR